MSRFNDHIVRKHEMGITSLKHRDLPNVRLGIPGVYDTFGLAIKEQMESFTRDDLIRLRDLINVALEESR